MSCDETRIVLRRIHIMEHPGVRHFDVEHGIRMDNALCAGRRIGAPQRIEDAAPENDRMPVPSAVRRARDGKGSGAERSQQRRNRSRRQERQIDWRDEDGAGSGTIGCVQTGEHRRKLTGVRVRIRHESNRAGQAFELVEERAIVGTPDDERVGGAAGEQRRRESCDECDFAGWDGQKGLRPAHPRGEARGENDAWDQTGRIVLSNGTTFLSVATTWL